VRSVAETPETPETPDEKRERVMARLAEILKGDPPDLSGSGPVSAGGFPTLPMEADQFDQESAAELLAVLGQFFERQQNEAGAEDPERE
jgi:hypothetical protein